MPISAAHSSRICNFVFLLLCTVNTLFLLNYLGIESLRNELQNALRIKKVGNFIKKAFKAYCAAFLPLILILKIIILPEKRQQQKQLFVRLIRKIMWEVTFNN